MTIAELSDKCKAFLDQVPRDVLIVAVLLLASTLSFGLGYLAGQDAGQGSEITIVQGAAASLPMSTSVPTPAGVGVPTNVGIVASKNGTKYYLPTCSGADRI